MLYQKSKTEKLDDALFENPTAEYRGAPFWAWNCKLEIPELHRQLEILKKMGFGGAHMHVRTGMATPYLSDEYMGIIKSCVEKAKSENMISWLYDEDRWPSGAAGGLVTKDHQYRARHLLFTAVPYTEDGDTKGQIEYGGQLSVRSEEGRLLACYDVELDENGGLVHSRLIGKDEPAAHEKWYAYLEESAESPWYNNQTYVNTLDKKAMDRFIEITYEAYNRTIADEFGKTVFSIFTDEPQFSQKSTLSFATEKKDVFLPWTDDLADTFRASYGEDLMEGLPELIWDRADGKASVIRYHFHDHICERFTEAFADNCGKWCREHGIALTGHMLEEDTLNSQTRAIGEAMRSYRGFDLPGIDMLCKEMHYGTVKQAQSAVHQFGREGLLSELYGVTGWDFDFRDHKLHGDWQAVLGVTARVPHLSWVSMNGEAKRDYPASINYQSPWWEQYSKVEDHFARVGTAMTRGRPVVKVGVIHPIESYWLHWGPSEQTALTRDVMDQNFSSLTDWLLFGGIDFDFISESLLPKQCKVFGAPLQVGEMAYDAILVPNCETLRSTTLERLEAFRSAGGKLIFTGELPTLADAVESTRGSELAKKSTCISFSRGSILAALDAERTIEIRRRDTGSLTKNLLYQMRQDGSGRWLFIAHGREPYNKDVPTCQDLRIRVKGCWKPTVYNTQTGRQEAIDYQANEAYTDIFTRMYDYDSLLLWLEPAPAAKSLAEKAAPAALKALELPDLVQYALDEPNVVLLDQAEYALDDEPWQSREEILRLDNICRKKLGWPTRMDNVAQPWTIAPEEIRHHIRLRWAIRSAIECDGISLGIEDAERVKLTFNGQAVPSVITGWYVDKCIKTVALPPLKKGVNILEAVIPFGHRTDTEWAYLLGNFGVEVQGRSVCIRERPEMLGFASVAAQGLPFYGSNVTYRIPFTSNGGRLHFRASQYRGAIMEISVDGGEKQSVIYPPYSLLLDNIPAGEHILELKLYGHRRNSFGCVHNTDMLYRWLGPDCWRTTDAGWCYEYRLREMGLLTAPVLEEEC